MRLSLVRFGMTCAMLAIAASGRATTCTITSAHIPIASQGLDGILSSLVGVAIPVTVTENSGSIAFDFSGLPAAHFSLSGVDSALVAVQAPPGTIDADGNIMIPNASIHFATDQAINVDIQATAPLTSGIASVTLGSTDYPTEGAPLDFSTGALTLEGQAALHNAPVVGDVTTGFGFACTLAPIPTKASLPKGPALAKAHGVGKPGDATTGDKLTLQAKFTNGATPIDPSTNDVFVRVTTSGGEVLLVRAPAGALSASGKKLSAVDSDGSVLHVLAGAKPAGNGTVPLSGSLTLKKSKKGFALTLIENGLDLSPLGKPGITSATVTVGVGPVTASDDAKVKATSKKLTLK